MEVKVLKGFPDGGGGGSWGNVNQQLSQVKDIVQLKKTEAGDISTQNTLKLFKKIKKIIEN